LLPRPTPPAADREDALRKLVAIRLIAGLLVGLVVPGGRLAEQLKIVAAEGASQHRSAHGGVGNIVVLVARVVDDVVAAAGDVTLKAHELVEQPVVLGQHDAARIEQRQRVTIQVALRLLARLVADAATLERLRREAASPLVAHNLADAVALEQRHQLVDDL